MTKNLIQHIERFIVVSEDLKNRLFEISKLQSLEKGKFLHKPNKVCNFTYFINSGLVRIYYKKGDKQIMSDEHNPVHQWRSMGNKFI